MKENTEVPLQETTHSLIKIKILLAYLEKILYLWAVEKVGLKKKTRSWKETNTGHQHCGIPQKIRTPLLDGIQPNERCFEPELDSELMNKERG